MPDFACEAVHLMRDDPCANAGDTRGLTFGVIGVSGDSRFDDALRDATPQCTAAVSVPQSTIAFAFTTIGFYPIPSGTGGLLAFQAERTHFGSGKGGSGFGTGVTSITVTIRIMTSTGPKEGTATFRFGVHP